MRALLLSIGDLADRRVLLVLVRSLVVTLLVFVGLGLLVAYVLDGADPCAWWSDDSCPLNASTSGLGALVFTAIGLWFLFPAIAIGVVSAYMDRIVAVVEARHYPSVLADARPLGWLGGAGIGLRSTLRVLVYNLIALPFYILLLVTGVGTILLFVAVNGLAFGRDLGEMVAARHGNRRARKAWLRDTRVDRAVMGAIVTAIFLVPFANLLAPVLGAAMATHLYHGTKRTLE